MSFISYCSSPQKELIARPPRPCAGEVNNTDVMAKDAYYQGSWRCHLECRLRELSTWARTER